jgi:hypothetical protein
MSDPKPTAPTPATSPTSPDAKPPATDGTEAQYEFSEAQNRVIADLAMAIVWVRLPLLVVGLLQAVIATGLAFRIPRDGAHIVGVLGHGLAAVVCFLLAGMLARAANSFAMITVTRGRDVSHLMTALRNLDAWFDTLAFFVKLYLFLLAILFIVMLTGLIVGFQVPAPVEV